MVFALGAAAGTQRVVSTFDANIVCPFRFIGRFNQGLIVSLSRLKSLDYCPNHDREKNSPFYTQAVAQKGLRCGNLEVK